MTENNKLMKELKYYKEYYKKIEKELDRIIKILEIRYIVGV